MPGIATIFVIQCAVAWSNFVLLSAVAMALNDTLPNAASMSRNTPRTHPILAMRRSIMWVTL